MSPEVCDSLDKHPLVLKSRSWPVMFRFDRPCRPHRPTSREYRGWSTRSTEDGNVFQPMWMTLVPPRGIAYDPPGEGGNVFQASPAILARPEQVGNVFQSVRPTFTPGQRTAKDPLISRQNTWSDPAGRTTPVPAQWALGAREKQDTSSRENSPGFAPWEQAVTAAGAATSPGNVFPNSRTGTGGREIVVPVTGRTGPAARERAISVTERAGKTLGEPAAPVTERVSETPAAGAQEQAPSAIEKTSPPPGAQAASGAERVSTDAGERVASVTERISPALSEPVASITERASERPPRWSLNVPPKGPP
jgi:hypothetical protein